MIPRPEVGRRERCSDRCPCRAVTIPPIAYYDTADALAFLAGRSLELIDGGWTPRPQPGPPLPVEWVEDERSEG